MPKFVVIMENKTIAPQKVVSLAYELTLSNGNLADEASADEPLVFIHGIGQTLPAFDERINGLSVGDKFSFLFDIRRRLWRNQSEFYCRYSKKHL
jgi:FKBP-type peptidyl-prolyl cis-trans isomerase